METNDKTARELAEICKAAAFEASTAVDAKTKAQARLPATPAPCDRC
jgi:hypothetical protein